MAEISIRDVRKSYGANDVIHGVSVDVADGEFIVIVGPSGCGKSTLLRMVAGLEEITSGEIAIGGQVVNEVEPKDRNIAMVFQTYALYPHMSVYDNMAYGLRIAGRSKADIEERVQRAAKLLQLGDLLQRKPRQLSGGQRQRVAMGRAIVREPAAFLFDEPLSNLDAKLRVQMRLEIRQLQRRLGTTSLYVTHDQVEAMTLADRLIVMNAGVAEQIDTPLAVYERPASIFVAGFIGSPAMNFFHGMVSVDGKSFAVASGGTVGLSRAPLTAHAGKVLALGVRPEHLQRVDGSGDLVIKVAAVETLGADTLAHGYLDGADGDSSIGEGNVAARLPGTARVGDGAVLHFNIGDHALHVFDAGSGRRMP